MKKLLLALLLVTFVAVGLPQTFAQENNPEAVQIVEEANDKINDLIEQAQADALVSDEDAEIIAELLAEAEEITAEAIEELAELGVIAGCVYIEVEIDGQVVLVDPIEVYHW